MAQPAPQLNVEPPAVVSRPFDLFSVSEVIEDASAHWRNGVQWESITCAPVSGVGPECSAPIGIPKTFNRAAELASLLPFTLYGSYTCSPAGRSMEEAQDRAEQHLLAHEVRGVEETVWSGSLGNTPTLIGATTANVTTAGQADGSATGAAQTPTNALRFLDAHAASSFSGEGVVHVPSFAIPHLMRDDLIEEVNGVLVVKGLGHLVTASAGSPGTAPDGSAAAATETWFYITPPVRVYRSEIFAQEPPAQTLARGTNDLKVLAERYYAVGWDDCQVAGVKVDLT